jgi:PKD repeat protein
VIFDEPGTYSVSLTATNVNGSASKTIESMIKAEGINMDFSEDFEAGETGNFILRGTERGKVTIDDRAAAPGSAYGLHFQGGGVPGSWTGGPTTTTPDQAWNINVLFHGFAGNCDVDASGIAGVTLTLDLRQTFTIGNKYSWFRVLVNDTNQVPDVDGVMDFNPATNQDPFVTRTFDLSAYGNSHFSITLQACCYLADGFNGLEGDNVFADNIMITNTTATPDQTSIQPGVLTYPNPAGDAVNFSGQGLGSKVTAKISSLQGRVVLAKQFPDYRDGQTYRLALSPLPSGIYLLQLEGDRGTVSRKLVVE